VIFCIQNQGFGKNHLAERGWGFPQPRDGYLLTSAGWGRIKPSSRIDEGPLILILSLPACPLGKLQALQLLISPIKANQHLLDTAPELNRMGIAVQRQA
jgi:hypothetical protein